MASGPPQIGFMKFRSCSNSKNNNSVFGQRIKRKVAEDDDAGLWATIPDDILCLVCEKLTFIEDFVRFCAACRSWYSFGTDHYANRKKVDFPPLFMLREDPESDSSTTTRTFRNYISGNSFVIELPEAAGRRCWGSPFGWIVTFGTFDVEFSLLNPFSRATITLPSLQTLLPITYYDPNESFIKAVLTASPDSFDCVVVLMIRPSEDSSILGLARPGDKAWSLIEGCPNDLNDVVLFQGSLYGCRNSSLELVLIQIEPPRIVEFAVLPLDMTIDRSYTISALVEEYKFKSIKYVVDLGGDLCLVLRYVGSSKKTFHFKMFKIDTNTKKWTKAWPSIGDQCLFLGNNYSFAYTCSEATPSASDKHFKANFIYFTSDDDLSRYGLDEGINNSLICRTLERNEEDFILNPSLWITPRLHFSCLNKSLYPKKMHGPLALLG